MKKRNIIIIAALLVIALVAVVLFVGGGKTQRPSESAEKLDAAQTEVTPEETMPEPGTVYLDEDKEISATLGVAKGDGAPVEDEEPEDTAPAPTPSATPAPSPSPTEPQSQGPVTPALTEYEVFYALSPEQKDAFLNSFESYEAFYEWLIAAQAEYAAVHPEIEIGPGGTIDLSQLP